MAVIENQPITLYYAPDNASLIVRLLLEELELEYKTVLVDRSVDAQQSEEYLKLNPDGLIPVCIINGAPVFETAAILLSTADSHARLSVPVSDVRRPQFLKWLFFLSNSLHNDLRQRFYPEKFVDQNLQSVQTFTKNTLQRLQHRCSIFNDVYRGSNSDYLFGAQPTIVDIYLAVCFRWAQLYPLDSREKFIANEFVSIIEMIKKLEQRPAVQRGCQKEGITGLFFSAPDYADPPEGVAL